jgi:hypothetical protein
MVAVSLGKQENRGHAAGLKKRRHRRKKFLQAVGKA